MAYKKKSRPKDLQKAQSRIDGMKSIEPALDFGSGVSVATLEAAVNSIDDKISAYNTALSNVDAMDNDIKAELKALNDLSSRALKAGEFKYGKDSSEYEMMGGTRQSERKKRTKKTAEKA